MALDAVMLWLSNWGAAIPVLCVLATRDRKAIINLVISLLFTWGLTEFLKFTVARPRPFEAGAAQLIGKAPGGWSFPSQHAAFTFTAATTTVLANRILGWIAFIFAALVAYSRVYLGVHYWSDVIAGAIIGSVIAYGVDRAMRQFEQRNKSRKKS